MGGNVVVNLVAYCIQLVTGLSGVHRIGVDADRLTFNGAIIETGTGSNRLAPHNRPPNRRMARRLWFMTPV